MTTVAAILRHKGGTSSPSPRPHDRRGYRVLSEKRIGAVLVQDSVDQLLGIVSERDIVRSLAANGARTLEMTAGQLMTRALKTATRTPRWRRRCTR